jgi:transcriptional antiterminator RfaH
MPILPPETDMFPENLFSIAASTRESTRSWSVFHTRPRQEKSVARELGERGLPFYLPLESKRTWIRGRAVPVQTPLFPGYVFFLGDEQERLRALATRRIVRTLKVHDQDELTRDLQQIRRLLASGTAVQLEKTLAPGSLVEITTGPLAGLRGTVLCGEKQRRILVAVHFLHQGASVRLDGDSVKLAVIDAPAPCGEPRTLADRRA